MPATGYRLIKRGW